MYYIRDEFGVFDIVSENIFDGLLVDWIDYKCNNKSLKAAGGMYVTVIYDANEGDLLIRRHYRSDYMRARGLDKLCREALAAKK